MCQITIQAETYLLVWYDQWWLNHIIRDTTALENMHILRLEKKPLLSHLVTESSSGSEEGSGGQQMTPNFLESIVNKSHTIQILKTLWRISYNTLFWMYKWGTLCMYVVAGVVTDRHTKWLALSPGFPIHTRKEGLLVSNVVYDDAGSKGDTS